YDSEPLVRSTIYMDEIMGGVTNLVLLLDSGDPEGIKEPAALAEVERLQAWADRQDLVRKTYSAVDILKDFNQTFHAEDPAFYTLPESRELVAQYLLLYESAGGT
ncbi:MAG: RND transporter, partial [Gammaproteobacteria bacterium]|nr:RND transporter [Gammaproteobacteria bacterium]